MLVKHKTMRTQLACLQGKTSLIEQFSLSRQITVGLQTEPLKTTGPVAKLDPCCQGSEESVCVNVCVSVF